MAYVAITILFVAAMACFIIINAAADSGTVRRAMGSDPQDEPEAFTGPEAEYRETT